MFEISNNLAYGHVSRKIIKKKLLFLSLIQYKIILKLTAYGMKFYPHFSFFLKPLIKKTFFDIFIGGETLEDVIEKMLALRKHNIYTILDAAIEAKENEEEWNSAKAEFESAILFASQNEQVKFVTIKMSSLSANDILQKVTFKQDLSAKEKKQYDDFVDRIGSIVRLAYTNKVSVLVDAEESWIQGAIDDVTTKFVLKYNVSFPVLYYTIQLYRRDRVKWLKNNFNNLTSQDCIPAYKIVRGAYIEKEKVFAKKHNLENPLWQTKIETDKSFQTGLQFCLDNIYSLFLIIATHNAYNTIYAANVTSKLKPPIQLRVHFSQLFGMSDNMTYSLSNANYHVSKYMPYGSVSDCLQYLLRRAIENSSSGDQVRKEIQNLKTYIK